MFRRTAVALLSVIVLAAGRAEAVTIRDVIELSKAGLSEQVLLALIEVDRGVFTIDAPTVKQLKAAGVSETVILALIRSGRTPPAQEPAPEPTVPGLLPAARACTRAGCRAVPGRRARLYPCSDAALSWPGHDHHDLPDGHRPRESPAADSGELREGGACLLGFRGEVASGCLATAADGCVQQVTDRTGSIGYEP